MCYSQKGLHNCDYLFARFGLIRSSKCNAATDFGPFSVLHSSEVGQLRTIQALTLISFRSIGDVSQVCVSDRAVSHTLI